MYLLDTNVISELRRHKPHGAVVQWLHSVPDEHLFICAVSAGEIQAGIELTRTQDPAKASQIESWLDQICAAYNFLPLTSDVFRTWAKLMHGTSNTLAEDAMIAATAKCNRLTVVTRNLRDFANFNVPLFDPFSFGASSHE